MGFKKEKKHYKTKRWGLKLTKPSKVVIIATLKTSMGTMCWNRQLTRHFSKMSCKKTKKSLSCLSTAVARRSIAAVAPLKTLSSFFPKNMAPPKFTRSSGWLQVLTIVAWWEIRILRKVNSRISSRCRKNTAAKWLIIDSIMIWRIHVDSNSLRTWSSSKPTLQSFFSSIFKGSSLIRTSKTGKIIWTSRNIGAEKLKLSSAEVPKRLQPLVCEECRGF